MRISGQTTALVSALLALGCGKITSRSPTSSLSLVGPHGGSAFALPNAKGYGEVVIEMEPVARGAEPRTRVVVYFLTTDLQTALAPPPKDVRVKLLFPDKVADVVDLSPQPKSDDPAGAARFASSPGSYLVDEPIGELTATLDGHSFTVPFAGVR